MHKRNNRPNPTWPGRLPQHISDRSRRLPKWRPFYNQRRRPENKKFSRAEKGWLQ